MRISCSSNKTTMSENLISSIKELGLNPIITPILVRVVYDGPNIDLGNKIVALFDMEKEKEIIVDYDRDTKKHRQTIKRAVRINKTK